MPPNSPAEKVSSGHFLSPFSDGTLGPRADTSYGQTLHTGARRDRARGTILNFLLEAKQEISNFTRTEILKKVRVLYANSGVVARLVDGAAQMCGTMSPKPSTADEDWNELALQAWKDGTSRGVLTACGKYSIADLQTVAYSQTFRDGDFFSVFARDESTGRARLHLYEGHQCGDDPSLLRRDGGFEDGVRCDKYGRPTHYRLLAPAERLGAPRPHVDVPASQLVAFIEYRLRAGQTRGLSRLAHGVPHLQDIDEILRFVKMGSKAAQMVAMSVTSTPEQQVPGTGLASGMYHAPAQGNPGDVPPGDGSIPEPQDDWIRQARREIRSQDAFDGAMLLDLPEGSRLALDHDSRPHPDVLKGLDWLISHVAVGFGMRPELAWDISKLGGANTRYILSDAAAWVERRQDWLVSTFLQRLWVYLISCEMDAGRLPFPSDPRWWACRWLAPQRQSVDFGRDGKLYMSQLQSGNMTRSRWYGLQQLDADEEDKALIAEIVKRKGWCSEAGLDYREVFPAPPSGIALVPAPSPSSPEAPEPAEE